MMHTTVRRLLLVTLAAALAASPLAPDARAATMLRPRTSNKTADLARQALGSDPDASWEAVQALRDMGEKGKPRLTGVVRQLLERGREVVLRASRLMSDPKKADGLRERLNTTRGKALANIARLQKGKPVHLAHQYYDDLDGMFEVLEKVFEVRDAVRRVMVTRSRVLPIWRDLGVDDRRFSAENEAKLAETAQAILGLPVAEVTAIPAFGQGNPPPAGSTVWHYWFWAACRRIEAYNEGLKRLMSSAEFGNLQKVNHYRELLGILPVEVDARLLQSARRHSKEMSDLGYFSHDSPKADHKDAFTRMKKAGYAKGAGENIAMGHMSSSSVFWAWFDSPGHHKNMAATGVTALGVGKWSVYWTQNFGRGHRIMLLGEDARNQVAVKGTVLAPRG